MSELFASPFFGIALSILAFWVGVRIQKKTGLVVCNPLLIGIVLVVGVLLLFRIPYESYHQGGEIINMFLAPATACLAVAIYEGEYPGALLAVAGGFLWDWTASRVGGLMALSLMAICFAAAVVVELYLRVNTVNFILVNAACCLLVTGMDFMFYYLMPGYSGAMERYLTTVLPMVIYTAVLSPLAMLAVRRVAGHFVPEQ